MANKKSKKEEPLMEEEILEKGEGDNLVNKIWNFFSSMKLGIVLLLILAVLSIIGTIIPQGQPPEQYNQKIYPLYDALGFDNLYHTWYYELLLFLLCMNLLICSLNRWQYIVKSIRDFDIKTNRNFLTRLKNFVSVRDKGITTSAFENAAVEALKNKGYRVFAKREDNTVYIAADKARYGVTGSFITHLSFIVIILGAIIGTFFGFKDGFIWAPSGGTFNITDVSNIDTAKLNDDQYFDVKVDKYWTLYNEDGSVKDYKSRLTVYEGGQKKVTKDIEVNSPLKYKGITFYQSAFTFSGPYKVKVTSKDGASNTIEVSENGIVQVPDSNKELQVYMFIPDYDPNYGTQSKSNFDLNPRVVYAVMENGQQKDMVIAEFNKPYNYDGSTVNFLDYTRYTGLQVKKDPGVPVVIAGSILMILGIFISVLLPPRKIWAMISQNEKEAVLEIGGLTQKNKIGFENEFNEIVNSVKEKIKGRELNAN